MAEQTPAEKAEQWAEVGKQQMAGMIDALVNSDLAKVLVNTSADATGVLIGTVFGLAAEIGTLFAKAIAAGEDVAAPALSQMVSAAVSDAFGADISPNTFAQPRNRGARQSTAQSLGRGVMTSIAGQAGTVQPGSEGAERYLGMVLNMALEGWYQGFLFEFATSMWPTLGIGQIESFAELDDTLSEALGLGRLSRRVLSPLVDATAIQPLRWHVNKTYRPELLGPGEAARQVARGRWTREQGLEELARQGYSPERSEAIFNAQRKFFSAGDVRTLVNREHWTRDQGIAHLKDQGFEEATALDALRLEGLRRIDQLEDAEATAIINAYADRRITKSQLGRMLKSAVHVASERAFLEELADVRYELNIRRITVSQAEQLVKAKIFSVRDYRQALERDGYPPEDVLALELLLRWELDKTQEAEALRAAAVAERAAEQAARDEARAARKAEVEASRAVARRGPLNDLERAVIRGLVPIARYGEVLRAEYDGDTVAILVRLVEDDRLAYLAKQQQREDVLQRAELRGLNVGQLERAVLEHQLAPADFRRHPTIAALGSADADLLTATLAARLEAQDAARRMRGQAEGEATKRAIDLPRFEALVRRGARTIAQYAELLRGLHFDDGAVAGMVELLELRLAEDAAARQARASAADTLEARGLSLEQFERAVLLGAKTIDEYGSMLVAENFTADAQMALLALLRDRLTEAEAARRRRRERDASSAAVALPLSTVRRAARLGVVSPAVYLARLQAADYSAEDIAIDVELLVLEIADVQAARARREQLADAPDGRGLTLAQLERAVKVGAATLEQYRAGALTLGYPPADVDLLVAVLADERAQLEDARQRRGTIAGELQTRDLSIAQLEEAVTKGFKSIEDFYADVVALGYGPDDAELLTALLHTDLAQAAAAPGAARP